ncbi:glycoside hydrolase family 127 protein [Pedobacter sp. P351]|uniref:glycoside hydrolase family 127 protein n=1 Tax=Pedobacter superstes TaxID=3133441 RepID=UPI0030A4C086
MNKNLFLLSFCVVFVTAAYAQKPTLKTFPLSSVKLLQGPFKEAQQTDLKYILELNPDRLLSPFLREAGIEPKGVSYGNWENTGLDGHVGGHYLSALSLMYASTGDKQLNERLNYMLTWLDKCQQKNGNGYVGGIPGGKVLWDDISKGKIKAGSFSLNDKWVPWYNIHKLYAGLVDAYRLTGNLMAKKLLINLSDWCVNLTANLSDTQIQQMLRSEHGGMNEVFADVTEITGEKKYLELARKFSHKAILNPLLHNTDSLNGIHANTQIPKVIGFMRVAQVAGDKDWAGAANFFWNTVVNNRTISIGGNSVREHFNPSNDFTSMLESREGPETCNSYNMLKLSKHLFLSDPSAKFIDYYERTTYNHILSSQHPEGGLVYFTPIRPNHYRVYSSPQESFWCCVGSGIENHGKYGELIYAHDQKNLYVNLYVPSTLNWAEKGINVTQSTTFPYEEKSTLKLAMKRPSRFAIKFRSPSWLNGKMKIMVNNQAVKVQPDANSYISIDRTWKSGDAITVHLPMETITESLPDKSNWLSFVHGPIVLAAATGDEGLTGLKADGSRMGHIASGPLVPLEEAPLLVIDNSKISDVVKPLNTQTLTYTASELIYQQKYKHLKLVPFYKIHDSRYVLYWPFTTASDLPKVQKEFKDKEEAKLKLEALTVDVINPGEQQPESDHNFKGEKTETGLFKEQHFRNGAGWFSYELRNSEGLGNKIRITYFGRERNKSFNIYINNMLLSEVKTDGSKGDTFYTVDYELPSQLKSSKSLTIKFQANAPSTISNIYEVRLMK